MQLNIQDLSFTYEGSFTPVFEHLSFNIDTGWRLGLIARNGRGKTTLLRILTGELSAQGLPRLPVSPCRFPYAVQDPDQLTLYVMQEMAPEAEEWQMRRELNLLQLDEDALWRPWHTLSQGEQTKVQLAALFSREDVWPLIDEPTNHLDLEGRRLTAAYLRKKDGFLLVSHDRAFLDECIDHVLAFNRSDTWVMQGGYTAYRERFDLQNETEQARNDALRKDIARLTESARRTTSWSAAAEQNKFHVSEDKQPALDRGYFGAKSAAMMKRSKSTLQRREKELEEKRSLLQNNEQVGTLKLTVLRHPQDPILRVRDGTVSYGSRAIASGIQLTVHRGDRIALTGPNGCGKSSVLKALCGAGNALHGDIHTGSGLIVSTVPQSVEDARGSMRAFIDDACIDETLFKAILRNMDFGRELFDQPLETMSMGQRKKLLIARSLCMPAHLYVWDEPLNYLDVYSRIQLEQLILTYEPTLLLVEHDSVFLQKVCTGTVAIG